MKQDKIIEGLAIGSMTGSVTDLLEEGLIRNITSNGEAIHKHE